MVSNAVRSPTIDEGQWHSQYSCGVSSEQYSGQRTTPWRQRYLDESSRSATESERLTLSNACERICVISSDLLLSVSAHHWPPVMMCTGPWSSPLRYELIQPIDSRSSASLNSSQPGSFQPPFFTPYTWRERWRYGTWLVFHGERSTPYGLVMSDMLRASPPESSLVYAQRPVVMMRDSSFSTGPNQSSWNMDESVKSCLCVYASAV